MCVVSMVTDHVLCHVVLGHVICLLQAGVAMVSSLKLPTRQNLDMVLLVTSQYWNVVIVAMMTVSHRTSLATGHLSSFVTSVVVYLLHVVHVLADLPKPHLLFKHNLLCDSTSLEFHSVETYPRKLLSKLETGDNIAIF